MRARRSLRPRLLARPGSVRGFDHRLYLPRLLLVPSAARAASSVAFCRPCAPSLVPLSPGGGLLSFSPFFTSPEVAGFFLPSAGVAAAMLSPKPTITSSFLMTQPPSTEAARDRGLGAEHG